MKTELYLIHNPYKRYMKNFRRSKNEKWILFNKHKVLVNYVVNKLCCKKEPTLTIEDLSKFLNLNDKVKEMVLEIYEMCKLKPYDVHNHDPEISLVKNHSWFDISLQKKLKNIC